MSSTLKFITFELRSQIHLHKYIHFSTQDCVQTQKMRDEFILNVSDSLVQYWNTYICNRILVFSQIIMDWYLLFLKF